MSRKNRPEAPTKRSGPSTLSDDAMTPAELAARIEAKYDAWLAERRLHPELGDIEWAADKPNPGQTFRTEPYPGLHLFTAETATSLRSAA